MLAAVLGAALPGTAVSFDAPDAGWAADRATDRATDRAAASKTEETVNAFLYQIREDSQARLADWEPVRDGRGFLVGRQPPVRRYRLCYLVTAWAASAGREHGLLSAALAVLASVDVIPPTLLTGSLASTEVPVTFAVGHPDAPAASWQIFTALGTRPRPALDLVVTAPLIPALLTEFAPPPEEINLGTNGTVPAAEPERDVPGWSRKKIRENS